MSAALDFNYQYAFSSGIDRIRDNKPQLSLATFDPNQGHPYFFDGRVRAPAALGDMLLTLSDVVRTHFFLPRPVLLDPVLTSNENLLRLEGFSGCCGVYARVDLPTDFFEGECHGRGTTNVDFNTPMRNALMQLRDNEDVRFSVGQNEVVLSRGQERTTEKKVKLPLRWIKGFSEVQAYQPHLDLFFETSAAEALKFIRTLPRSSQPKTPSYALKSGNTIRLSQRPQNGAVRILGTHRVRVIEPLLARARSLRVWYDRDNGTSAWEVRFESGSFFLMISPEIYRGFSGEGQILSDLVSPPSETTLAQVQAQLKWQSQINLAELAAKLDLSPADVASSLAILGSRGLAGFDAVNAHYFHRELPFDLGKVEELQPRLKNARKLVDGGSVKLLARDGEKLIYEVAGTGTHHRVQLTDSQETCTCPWFSKYQGERGPCKHILAAQLVVEDESK